MIRGIDGFGSKLLCVSMLALLGIGGCGKVGVSQNDPPSSMTPPGESGGPVAPTPTSPTPGQPTNPTPPGGGGGGGGTGGDPVTPNPPTQAVGEPATATANGAVLTSTRTTVYNLNSSAIGEGNWEDAALLENDNSQGDALAPRVAFDAAGNGFAVWTFDSGYMYASRYIASAADWSAPLRLDSNVEFAREARVAVDRQSGNAIAAWVQSDGTALSQYVSLFDAAASLWSAPQLVENTDNAVALGETTSVSIAGNQAAIAWRQSDGARINIYLSRLVNGAWTAPAVVDTRIEDGLHPEVAIDASGNAIVVWRQRDVEFRIYARRWNNGTQTFGEVMALDEQGDRQPRIGFDAAGNGFALWRGGGIYVRRYDVATDQWSAPVTVDDQTGDPRTGELAVDADGNAIAAWVQISGGDISTYTARYSAATASWGAPMLMETSDQPANPDKNPTVSLSGQEAVVAWIQQDIDARDTVYARKLSAGVWGPVTALEARDENADHVFSTVNAGGNAGVVWIQGDGLLPSVYEARYLSSNFVVPNGASWQSLANTLYGVNSAEGGSALQAALSGGSAPTPGTILNGLPATLSVTTSIPAYYTVLATDTWSHVAQTVYGVTDVNAIAELRDLLGNPTLAAGVQLVVPLTFDYLTSAQYSAPLDWSRVNTTTTTYHTLDASALTVALDSWTSAEVLEYEFTDALQPSVAFDANSNGLAVWAQASDLMVSRYVASTKTWSTPVALDSNTNDVYTPRLAMDRATGDAVVSWTQSDGVAESMYVSSFDASANSWSTPALLETSPHEVSLSVDGSAAAKAGEHAAIAWLQSNGTENNVYLSRFVGGTWTAPALIDADTDEAQQAGVAIDTNGNATVIWRQYSPAAGEHRIFVRRWDNGAQAYGAVTAIDGDGDRFPRIAFDAQGNGFALWGGGAYVRRFNVITGQWGPQMQLHVGDSGGWNGELAVDAAGNALAAWMENDGTAISTFARYYDVTTQTWSAAVSLENSTNPVSVDRNLTLSLVDGSGVVAWVQENDRPDVHAARFANGTWGPAALLETRFEIPSQLASGIDADDNATVLWIQADGGGESVFQAVSNATPYYRVPAGATWRSIAAALYDVDSDSAAEALRIAMGNPTLSTGLDLQALPAMLIVTPPVPTHYIVQNGDTWASITLKLYGTDRAEAADALQTYLGDPALTIGAQLLIPAELLYTVTED